jgi:hypothetical protein
VLPGPSLRALRAGLRFVIMCLKVCCYFLCFVAFWGEGVELRMNADLYGDIGNYIRESGVNVGPPLGQPTIQASP